MYKPEIKELIRSSVKIEDLLGRYTKLRPTVGGEMGGLCPFHKEKSPSFSVSPAKQVCYCFGCGQGGDVFSVLQKLENFSFSEALEILGKEAGIEVSVVDEAKQSAIDAMAVAKEHYLENVPQSMLDRGFTLETLSKFEVGEARGSLRDASKGYFDKLGELGFFNGNSEVLKNRVVFFVSDKRGQTVGFSGRRVGQDGPKYMHNANNALAKRSDVLYGLHLARKSASKSRSLIVVEGMTDVLRLHQCGFENAVAVSGAGLHANGASEIERLKLDTVYIVGDGDTAGSEGAYRTSKTGLGRYVVLRFVSMPSGEDPDSYLQKFGRDAFANLLLESVTEDEFLFEHAVRGLDDAIPSKKMAYEKLRWRLDGLMPFDESGIKLAALVSERLLGGQKIEAQKEAAIQAKRLTADRLENHSMALLAAIMTLPIDDAVSICSDLFLDQLEPEAALYVYQKALLEFRSHHDAVESIVEHPRFCELVESTPTISPSRLAGEFNYLSLAKVRSAHLANFVESGDHSELDAYYSVSQAMENLTPPNNR